MVENANSVHAIPTAAPGILTAIDASTLPAAKAIDIPRLLISAAPPPREPPASLFDHGIGTKIDSAH